MKKLLLSSAIVLGLFAPSAITQQRTAATVASVGDGNIIRVKEGNKVVTVRLPCIDAAEMVQKPCRERAVARY